MGDMKLKSPTWRKVVVLAMIPKHVERNRVMMKAVVQLILSKMMSDHYMVDAGY